MKVAAAVNYVGAGTVEFLRDGSGAVQWIRLTGRIARRIEDRP